MKMSPAALTVGTLVLLFTIIGIVLVVPVLTEIDDAACVQAPEEHHQASAKQQHPAESSRIACSRVPHLSLRSRAPIAGPVSTSTVVPPDQARIKHLT